MVRSPDPFFSFEVSVKASLSRRVRATYVTPRNNYGLDPAFLGSITAPTPAEMRDRLAQGRAPLFHVVAEDFIPSLLSSDVEKIDNLRATKGGAHPVPEAVRAKVIGSKTARPQVASKAFKEKNIRECAFCRETKEKDLMVCARYVHFLADELTGRPADCGRWAAASLCIIADANGVYIVPAITFTDKDYN